MRTTLNLDDDLLERAQKFTGLNEKTALVREALQDAMEIQQMQFQHQL